MAGGGESALLPDEALVTGHRRAQPLLPAQRELGGENRARTHLDLLGRHTATLCAALAPRRAHRARTHLDLLGRHPAALGPALDHQLAPGRGLAPGADLLLVDPFGY